jgi:hypothetical protein
MRIAWIILFVSVLTDVLVTAGGALSAANAQAKGDALNWTAIGWAFGGAGLMGLRTIQAELKAVGIKLSDLLRDAINRDGGTLPPPNPEVKP